MSEDIFIHKINRRYSVELLSGKENTYILRRKDGIILAFIEKRLNNIVSFRSHQNRKIPASLLRYLSAFFIKHNYDLSAEVAKALGISIIRQDNRETYFSFADLKRGKFIRALNSPDEKLLTINSLKPHNLTFPDECGNVILSTLGAKIKSLKIGRNCSMVINFRQNRYIKEIKINKDFTGKIFLADSSAKYCVVGDNARAEISYASGDNPLDLKIGNDFQGALNVRSAYLRNLNIGQNCNAKLNLEFCICNRFINIGAGSRAEIACDNVFARHIFIGSRFSGYFRCSGQNSRQGVRRVTIGDDFSGHADFSNNRTIQRLEAGQRAGGLFEIIGSPSVRVAKFDDGFDGEADFSESGIVYVRALAPCAGRLIFRECSNLTLLKLPLGNDFKIIGTKKPLKINKNKQYAFYYFKQGKLPKEYFSSWTEKLTRIFHRLFR